MPIYFFEKYLYNTEDSLKELGAVGGGGHYIREGTSFLIVFGTHTPADNRGILVVTQ